uniref:Calponin-homology (CH) domain-containing protein n=1 Tax=Oncorhynchus kisutch TaxID=8019 RepID=A0A8C7JLA7_ONCKI
MKETNSSCSVVLSQRIPPCMVLDLFNDFRDGSKLLDLLEVMSIYGPLSSLVPFAFIYGSDVCCCIFQHRSNIETALSFLKKKSVRIKLVNINIPDIIDGKPSIILGLIWTIIMQYHVSLSQNQLLDSRSTLSARSTSNSPVPPRGSPLHQSFRVSAKKALLLWVREQAGCTLNVKDFKASWRSGVLFLSILYALRPDLVDLSKARTRTNRQNLEEAFRTAERELRIPRLLEPDDVDVRDPDEKSIMTYVSQFLQYSRDMPVTEDDMQVLIIYLCFYSVHKYIVLCACLSMFFFHLFAWLHFYVIVPAQLREYKTELDLSLPASLDMVGRWLLRAEGALAEEEGDPQDHAHAAEEAREKLDLLKVISHNLSINMHH